jgi:hypothetical protein
VLLSNAAHVVQHGLDPSVLYWPRDLHAETRASKVPAQFDSSEPGSDERFAFVTPTDPPDDVA